MTCSNCSTGTGLSPYITDRSCCACQPGEKGDKGDKGDIGAPGPIVKSADLGNLLTLGADGYLYVNSTALIAAGFVNNITDTPTLDLNKTGGTISGTVKLSTDPNQTITVLSDGLFVPKPSIDNIMVIRESGTITLNSSEVYKNIAGSSAASAVVETDKFIVIDASNTTQVRSLAFTTLHTDITLVGTGRAGSDLGVSPVEVLRKGIGSTTPTPLAVSDKMYVLDSAGFPRVRFFDLPAVTPAPVVHRLQRSNLTPTSAIPEYTTYKCTFPIVGIPSNGFPPENNTGDAFTYNSDGSITVNKAGMYNFSFGSSGKRQAPDNVVDAPNGTYVQIIFVNNHVWTATYSVAPLRSAGQTDEATFGGICPMTDYLNAGDVVHFGVQHTFVSSQMRMEACSVSAVYLGIPG